MLRDLQLAWCSGRSPKDAWAHRAESTDTRMAPTEASITIERNGARCACCANKRIDKGAPAIRNRFAALETLGKAYGSGAMPSLARSMLINAVMRAF